MNIYVSYIHETRAMSFSKRLVFSTFLFFLSFAASADLHIYYSWLCLCLAGSSNSFKVSVILLWEKPEYKEKPNLCDLVTTRHRSYYKEDSEIINLIIIINNNFTKFSIIYIGVFFLEFHISLQNY